MSALLREALARIEFYIVDHCDENQREAITEMLEAARSAAPGGAEPTLEQWNKTLLAIVNGPWSASRKLDNLRDVLSASPPPQALAAFVKSSDEDRTEIGERVAAEAIQMQKQILQAPSAASPEVESLPPLPEPRMEDVDGELWGQNIVYPALFDADQMREFARAAKQKPAITEVQADLICAWLEEGAPERVELFIRALALPSSPSLTQAREGEGAPVSQADAWELGYKAGFSDLAEPDKIYTIRNPKVNPFGEPKP